MQNCQRSQLTQAKVSKHFTICWEKVAGFKIQKYTKFMAGNKNSDYIECIPKHCRTHTYTRNVESAAENELEHLWKFSTSGWYVLALNTPNKMHRPRSNRLKIHIFPLLLGALSHSEHSHQKKRETHTPIEQKNWWL